MCEYCGCQAVSVIAELTREHECALDAARAAEQAAAVGDLEAARSALRDLQGVLGPHTVVEEEGLFPAIAREFPEQVHVLRLEHRLFEDVCADVLSGQPSPRWAADVSAAMSALHAHILKEQDGVFPAAMTVLHAVDWEVAEDVRASVHTQPVASHVGGTA
ncbi:MAG: hemerythrin domain-containing protein [Frankiaceae bacterium]|nr:hemerythrin domain-containing protein [Frankiaceae bacterium]